jgi:hypothetical protein
MLTEKLAGIPVISKLALIFGITGAAIFAKNKDYVKKMISKTVDEFLPTLKERTPTIMDKTIVIIAKTA